MAVAMGSDQDHRARLHHQVGVFGCRQDLEAAVHRVEGEHGARIAVFDRTYLSLSLIGSGLMIILLATNWAMVS